MQSVIRAGYNKVYEQQTYTLLFWSYLAPGWLDTSTSCGWILMRISTIFTAVCSPVCEQNNSKNYGQILVKTGEQRPQTLLIKFW